MSASASAFKYDLPSDAPSSAAREDGIEYGFIGKLQKHGLKTLGVNPRRATEQIASPQNDPGNGYIKSCDGVLGLPSFGIHHSSFGLSPRAYQVYAVQHMLKCIGDDDGNGFVWHTTGSGKTPTSFKASTLLKENDNIHKCVFVVDRKDLDRQTREEFNKFQEGCVEENTNPAALVRRLLSEDYADKVMAGRAFEFHLN